MESLVLSEYLSDGISFRIKGPFLSIEVVVVCGVAVVLSQESTPAMDSYQDPTTWDDVELMERTPSQDVDQFRQFFLYILMKKPDLFIVITYFV